MFEGVRQWYIPTFVSSSRFYPRARYATTLSEALRATMTATASGPSNIAASLKDAAEALITARRRGEVQLRLRDEATCVEAERAWETKLGRLIEGSEWEGVKLFEDLS